MLKENIYELFFEVKSFFGAYIQTDIWSPAVGKEQKETKTRLSAVDVTLLRTLIKATLVHGG